MRRLTVAPLAWARWLWLGPAGLPRDVHYEWRFIALRWLGIAVLLPTLPLVGLSPDRQTLALGVLLAAGLYNLAVSYAVPRHPALFKRGYVTAIPDAALDVVMILVWGGFDSPFYYVLFTITLAVAMRYGYGPALAQTALIVAVDGLTGISEHGGPDVVFVIRSLFLTICALLASLLRQQTLQAEEALKERLRQTDFLNDSVSQLSASLELAAVLAASARTAGELFDARCVAIRPAAELGPEHERERIVHWQPSEQHACSLSELSQLLDGSDGVSDGSPYPPPTRPLRSGDEAITLRLALATRARALGTLAIALPKDRATRLPERDVIASFVDQTALALENASLYQTLANLYQEVGRRAEALHQSESFLRAIQDHIVDGVLTTDDHGIVLSFNTTCEQIFGYRAEEVLGRSAGLFSVDPSRKLGILDWARSRSRDPKRFEAREIRARRKDGTIFPIELDGTSTTMGSRQILIFTVRDITARKETEEALARSEKLRALGQLASGVAHDLNQSLALVTGHAELALHALESGEPSTEQLREALTVVLRAALDGAETVTRLLTFARAPSDAGDSLIDLSTLIRETVQLTAPRWRDAAQAEAGPVALEVEIAGTPTIVGSPAAMREALTNLVLNAVDAMPRGGRLRLTARSEQGRAIVEVQDNGTGMPPQVQAKIFEPFYTTKGERGSGLGLAVVFGVVERHKGQISVRSAPNEGSTFRLEFPAAETHSETHEVPPREPYAAPALDILAVDDEPALARMAALMLEHDGHRVSVATSGEEALRRLAAGHYDLVVSDVGMGEGMNGWELAGHVRERWPGTRVVLATGWGAQIDAEKARSRGVDAVLAKPYRREDLRAALACVRAPDAPPLERAA